MSLFQQGGRDALEGRSCKWDTRKPETAVNQPSVAVDAKCFSSPSLSSLWFLFYGSILPCHVLHSFIVFASFSRFSPTALLLTSSPQSLQLCSLRIRERWEKLWQRSAGHTDGNSRDSQFQYNLQAIPPRLCIYIRISLDSSKVGWNSIQTNLTLARLLKPEGCLFYDRCRPPFPFYRLELSFVI